MKARQLVSDETELNMTPMIDIVFQLLIFFLLSLKFKTIDRRIETMLPDNKGEAKTVQWDDDDSQKIKLKVFRREIRNAERAYTLVKLDNAAQFSLPAGWKGRLKETPERKRAYDRVLASVEAKIEERVAAYGGISDQVKGEIKAPLPRGGSVPHGDVIALLDLFLRVGVTDVEFEGTMRPLSTSQRAARAAAR